MTCNTEERYLNAINSSNLRVEADRTGPADILICAGWSRSMIGGALMRLHTKPNTAGLCLVREQVLIEADRLGIKQPERVCNAVISWWINRVCATCHGRKFDVIEGAPSLSEVRCPACNGAGEEKVPYSQAGRDLASYLDQCKASWVDLVKRRMKARRA